MLSRLCLSGLLLVLPTSGSARSSIGMCEIDQDGFSGVLEWTFDPGTGESAASFTERNLTTSSGTVTAVRPHIDGSKINIRFEDMVPFKIVEMVVKKTSDMSRVGFVELERTEHDQVVSVIIPFSDATCLIRNR